MIFLWLLSVKPSVSRAGIRAGVQFGVEPAASSEQCAWLFVLLVLVVQCCRVLVDVPVRVLTGGDERVNEWRL